MQPTPSPQLHDPGTEAPLPLAPEVPRSLLAGSVWGAIALWSAGLGWPDLLPLVVGASCTVLLALVAWSALERQPQLRAGLVFGGALLGVCALLVGQVLQAHTHHRPLGAVTWVLLLGCAIAPLVLLVRRMQPNNAVALGLLVVVLCACGWLGRDAIGFGGWSQCFAGGVCFAGALLHRRRFPLAARKLALPIGIMLLTGAAWSVWSNAGTRLFEHAPLPLGVLGVLGVL
jgi:hypothetical protein